MSVTTNLMSTVNPDQNSPALLNSHDRCDGCGSQAYVSVDLGGDTLLFCGHHYQQHELALATVVVALRDERFRLLAAS